MSIANTRLRKIVNEIIENEIKSGIIISSTSLAQRIKNILAVNNLSAPFFKARKLKEREKLDCNLYNMNLSEIIDDLKILYDESRNKIKVIKNNFNYYETERKNLKNEIQNTKLKLAEIIANARKQRLYYFSLSEEFTNPHFTDIYQTNCDLNTSAGYVSNLPGVNTFRKHNLLSILDTINVDIKTPVIKQEEISERTLMVDGINTQTWVQKIESAETSCTLKIEVKLKEAVLASEIVINTEAGMQMQIALKDKENDTWLDIGEITTKNVNSIQFDGVLCEGISLSITKIKPDSIKGTGGEVINQFFIYINEIELLYKEYSNDSEYYSKMIYIPEGHMLGTVTLDAKVETPQGTDIKFYIRDRQGTEWKEIVPLSSSRQDSKVVVFNNVIKHEKVNLIARKITSAKYKSWKDLYEITERKDGKLENILKGVKVIEESISMLSGYKQIRYEYFDKDISRIKMSKFVTNLDFDKPPKGIIKYDIEKSVQFISPWSAGSNIVIDLFAGKYLLRGLKRCIRYTVFIVSKENISNFDLNISFPTNHISSVIYFNNEFFYNESNKFSTKVNIRKGLNTFRLTLNVAGPITPITSFLTISLPLFNELLFEEFYGGGHMQYQPYLHVLKSIDFNNSNKFSIIEEGGEEKIIVFDRASVGCIFKASYWTIDTTKTSDGVYLKAVLLRDKTTKQNKNFSARLLEYTLNFGYELQDKLKLPVSESKIEERIKQPEKQLAFSNVEDYNRYRHKLMQRS